jgi:hypothetical protein
MTAALRLQRILFLVSAHNGLSQRAYVELTELGHEVGVAVVDSAAELGKGGWELRRRELFGAGRKP